MGEEQWTKTFGGENDDFGESVIQTSKEDYLITGGTYSYGHGDCDVLLVKITDDGLITKNTNFLKPTGLILYQNFPNPFGEETTIEFELFNDTKAAIYLYNSQGKLIKTVGEKFYTQGKHNVKLNSSGLSEGIYFYKLQTISSFDIKKMIILKN